MVTMETVVTLSASKLSCDGMLRTLQRKPSSCGKGQSTAMVENIYDNYIAIYNVSLILSLNCPSAQ